MLRNKLKSSEKKVFFMRERTLFIIGVLLFFAILATVVWSVDFLRKTVVPALTGEGVVGGDVIRFDIDRYNALDLGAEIIEEPAIEDPLIIITDMPIPEFDIVDIVPGTE